MIALYQDWRPFLAAIGFVLLQHPWVWAGVHSGFILAMSVAGMANWKFSERSQSQLSRLAAIVESSADAIYGWATDGTINSWNRGAVELFGYSHDEIVGQSFVVLVPPLRRDETRTQFEHIRQGHGVEPFDTQRLHKDGTLVDVSVTVSCVKGPLGDVVGGSTIARDITARCGAEAALRASEAELQRTLSLVAATLEATADGIFVSNLQGEAVSFNTPFADMWQVPESLRGLPDMAEGMAHAIGLLADPDAFLASTGEVFAHPDDDFHDILYFQDGLIYERSSRPQRVDGVVVGRVWNFHDITERRGLEAELAEARDEALESSRLKSDFLATMSHEIRTPMNGVIGLTGLLLDSPLTDTQRQYAEGVRTSGESLLGIINDILDFSKIEAGKLELEMVDFDLAEALDDVAFLVAESARAKGLELVAYCHPGMPTMLRGDVGRLRQILLNLVANAVKFTAEGEVVLRASVGHAVRLRRPRRGAAGGARHRDRHRARRPPSGSSTPSPRPTPPPPAAMAAPAWAWPSAVGWRRPWGAPSASTANWAKAASSGSSCPWPGPPIPLAFRRDRAGSPRPADSHRRRQPDQPPRPRGPAPGVGPGRRPGARRLRRPRPSSSTRLEEGRPYDLALVDMAMPGRSGMDLARIVKADPALRSVRLLLLTSVSVGADEAARAGFSVCLTKPARLSQLYEALVRALAPPAPEPAPPRAPAPAEPTTNPGTKGRLLIVEDNAINQAVARAMVGKLGYSCDVAGNGIEALAASDRRHYDLVLMDCQMPEMDGYEATAEIRRREARRRPGAHHRHDRRGPGGGPRTVPRRRHGRLPVEAGEGSRPRTDAHPVAPLRGSRSAVLGSTETCGEPVAGEPFRLLGAGSAVVVPGEEGVDVEIGEVADEDCFVLEFHTCRFEDALP